MIENPSDEPEELHDLSELSFSFEDSRSSPVTDDVVADSADALNIDDFNLEGNSDSPLPEINRPKPEPEPPVPSTPEPAQSSAAMIDEDLWFTQSLGNVLGPMPFYEVAAMIESGTLTSTDQARQSSASEWQQLNAFAEFQTVLGPEVPATPAEATPAEEKSVRKKKAKKKRSKKKAKKDELLQEIFSDVFSEDGKVRSHDERPDLKATAAPTQPAHAPSNITPALSSDTTATPPIGTPQPLPTAAGSAHRPPMPNMAQQAVFRPKKKSSSFDAKPILIGVSAVAVIGLIGWYVTSYGLPSLSGTNYTALFNDFQKKYEATYSAEMPIEDWRSFTTEFGIQVNTAYRECSPYARDSDYYAARLKVLTQMIKILHIEYDNSEKLEENFTKYKSLVSGL